jgi:hypothetical protein
MDPAKRGRRGEAAHQLVPRSATFARSRWSLNRYQAVDLRCRPVRADCHLGAQSVFATVPHRHLAGSSITPRDRVRCRLVKSPVS